MFTGIVQSLASIVAVSDLSPGVRITVRDEPIAARASVGDSVAMNGCCLTVVAINQGQFGFDASPETLARTNLGALTPGEVVNLETSLRAGDELGGHLVTGHIDAVGIVDQRIDEGQWCTMWFRAPSAQLKQMASKGSIAVDGVSLTLVDVNDQRFSVALIPHTLKVTTLGSRAVGHQVNLETDVLAKYVQRQLEVLRA